MTDVDYGVLNILEATVALMRSAGRSSCWAATRACGTTASTSVQSSAPASRSQGTVPKWSSLGAFTGGCALDDGNTFADGGAGGHAFTEGYEDYAGAADFYSYEDLAGYEKSAGSKDLGASNGVHSWSSSMSCSRFLRQLSSSRRPRSSWRLNCSPRLRSAWTQSWPWRLSTSQRSSSSKA